MTAPSTPTTPGSHSRGALYKQGTVISVEGNLAIVRTTLTETLTVRRDIMRAKGRLPEVGETWLLTKEFSNWVFSLIVIGGDKSNLVPQSDVIDLTDDLDALDTRTTSAEANIVGLDTRADAFDGKFDFLYRWAYVGGQLNEATIYIDYASSIPRYAALQSVAVAGAGRYINLGITPGAYQFTGCHLYVTGSVSGATIQIGLYHGTALDNFVEVTTASVSAASGGAKSGTFAAPYTTVPGEYLAVGLATTTASTVAISGCENGILNSLRAQVADLGATSLVSSLVMGPTTPYTTTQGRHWVSLF